MGRFIRSRPARRPSSNVRCFAAAVACAAAGLTSIALAQAPANPPPGVHLVDPVAVRITKPPGATDASFEIAVRNTTDVPQTLPAPVLCALGLAGSGTTVLQTGAPSLGMELDADGRVTLQPHTVREIRLTVKGIEDAGKYEGRACFAAKDLRLDVPFTVVVKSHFGIAGGLIGLGVVVSEAVRWYLTRSRKRLVQRRDLARIAGAFEELRARTTEPRILDVLASLRRQVDRLDADIVSRGEEAADDEMKAMANKLPLVETWAELRQATLQLDPGAAKADLLVKLDAAETTLRNNAAKAKEVTEELPELQKLSLPQAEREALRAALMELDRRSTAGESGDDEELSKKIGEEVRPRMKDARDALDGDRREEARSSVEEARTALASALIEALGRVLAGDPPPRVDEAGWKALGAKITGLRAEPASTGNEAIRAYEEAHKQYSILLARGLLQETKTALAGPSLPNPTEAQTAARKRLQELELELKKVVEGTGPRDATDLLREVRNELVALTRLPGGFKVKDTAAGAGERMQLLGPLPGEVGGGSGAAVRSEERLTGTLRGLDFSVTAVLLFVAVISGLRVLWAGQDVWGTPSDHLAALLWGFGLHQIGNVPFEGLAALRERLSKLTG